jgi:hypothetical protein
MKFGHVAAIAGSLGFLAAPMTAASAQSAWTPGAEIVGQSVQVQTNGVVNTVYFDQGGVARIATPSGKEVSGNWTAANQQLCLTVAGGASPECWPYQSAFQQGQAVTLTSSCNVSSQWVANGVNQAPMESRAGERG